jgi:arylsulfatase A-like enzyme
LKTYAADPQSFEDVNPSVSEVADKFPLVDTGTGENPFFIKKKMPLGLVEISTLFAPPKSHFTFPVKIPENAFLEFTFGIRKDSQLARDKNKNRSTRFLVSLRKGDQTVELFNKTLSLSSQQDLVFDYKKIDLTPYAGKTVTLHLLTRGDKESLACWFNPVIYSPQERPRCVILVSLDTLRPDHLGCYGYSRDTSPFIDRLAEDSVLFENSFATSPWTLPSHVSLLTALNCINHQVYQSDEKMDPSILTVADFLREKGYFTSAFTGGGYVSAKYGFSKGFDSYHMRGRIQSSDSAEIISKAALNWIERHRDRNFFLFLHTYQIHNPYSSPPPFNKMFLEEDALYDRIDMGPLGFNHEKRYLPVSSEMKENIIALYDGEIRYTDEVFVRTLVEKLKDLGLYSDSLIILTSDHGEEFFEHGAWLHTHSVYNETINIPLMIKYPGFEHAGTRVKSYSRLIDIMPTILDELNIEHRGVFMDGRSLEELIGPNKKRGSSQERIFLSELAYNASRNRLPKRIAMNRNLSKLIINDDFPPEFLAFYIYPPPHLSRIEAYDLKSDPHESRDLSTTSPEFTRQLLEYVMAAYEQKRMTSTEKMEVDAQIEEQLRALGYIR